MIPKISPDLLSALTKMDEEARRLYCQRLLKVHDGAVNELHHKINYSWHSGVPITYCVFAVLLQDRYLAYIGALLLAGSLMMNLMAAFIVRRDRKMILKAFNLTRV